MTDSNDLTPEEFNSLLLWLGPTRERGAERYEQLHRSLVRILSYRGCVDAEELADETINRVARKLPALVEKYRGNPANYFYGVADKVFLGHLRARRKLVSLPPQVHSIPSPEPQDETYLDCLEECLRRMGPEERELVELYYHDDTPTRIGKRKDLARRLGLSMSNLRVKVFRLLGGLQQCTEKCVGRKRREIKAGK